AAHFAGGGAGLGARCLRCDALLAGAGVVDARFWDVEDGGWAVGHVDFIGVGDWRGWVWISGGPHRAEAGVDGEHLDVFGVLVCFGTVDQYWHAGGGAVCAWTGHGRRVEYRGYSGRGK